MPEADTRTRDQQQPRLYGLVIAGAGSFVVGLSLFVLLGWFLESPAMVQLSAAWAPTQPSTAIGLGLCGLSLLGFVIQRRALTVVSASLVLILGLLTILQYASGLDLLIDTWIVTPFTFSQSSFSGRMSLESATSFFLIGAALLFVCVQRWQEQHDLVSALAGTAVSSMAVVNLGMYFAGATSQAYGWGGYSRMSIYTTVGMIACGVAVIAVARVGVRTDRIVVPRWFPLTLGAAAAIIAVSGWQATYRQDQIRAEKIIGSSLRTQLTEYERHLREKLLATAETAERMAIRASIPGPDSEYRWETGAFAYLEDEPATISVEWFSSRGEYWAVESKSQIHGSDSIGQANDSANNPVPIRHEEGSELHVLTREGRPPAMEIVSAAGLHGPPVGSIRMTLNPRHFFPEALNNDFADDCTMAVSIDGKKVFVCGSQQNQGHEALGATSQFQLLGRVFDLHLWPSEQLRRSVSEESSVGLILSLILLVISLIGGTYLARQLMIERTEFRDLRDAVDRACIIAATDTKGRITHANKKFVEISQYSQDELLGQDHRLLNSGLHPKEFFADMWGTIERGKVWRGEVRNRRKDGTLYWLNTTIVPFLNAAGQPFQYLALRIDVTAQKEAEAKLAGINDWLEDLVALRTKDLEAANQALEQSNRELEQFAYVASHDLQEPLRMVASYTELLSRRYRDVLGQDGQEFVDFAVDGAHRMQQLIKDLLAFSRVATRGKPFAPVRLSDVMEDVLRDLTLSIEESGAEVLVDSLPDVRADYSQVKSVLTNLVSNAIKYRGSEHPIIRIGSRREDDKWVVWVADNGIGIEGQYFDRIFILFQRLHTRHSSPGTGIGLAIAKRIVERHGGKIWVESAPGMGSTFYFTLIAVDSAQNMETSDDEDTSLSA